VLQLLDRHDQAIPLYEKARAIEPGFAVAHNDLGVALLELGKLEEARRAFEKAIELQPDRPWFYRNLIALEKITPGDRYFTALRSLAENAQSLSGEEQIHLHFALGKAFADIGDQQRSFRHFLEGNALKRQQTAYDEAATQRMFDRIRAVFTPELMQARAGQGDPSALPIFILGMPRSGSTLIEQVLASHPQVFGGGERLDLGEVLNSIGDNRKVALPFPEYFLLATGEELRRLGAAYIERIKLAADPGSGAGWLRITDKLPGNFPLVGVIHLAMPNARIIHSRRDPVDTCLSCFSNLFHGDQSFTYDLGELGRYHRGCDALMQHWRGVLPPDVMLDVQYEELVDDFEPQARRVLAHCGLEWDDACLAFDRTVRPVRTASMVQVRQPLFRSSIGRWRPDQDVLRPLLDGLGPDPAGNPGPAAARDGSELAAVITDE